mgnify:CR=1 FL=1
MCIRDSYYRVHLDDEGVDAELTASARVGVHRYAFPKGEDAFIVLDLEHRDKLLGSQIRMDGQDVVGERRSSSWARDQRLYFCVRVGSPDGPVDLTLDQLQDSTKAVLRIPGEHKGPLIVKVGISSVSIEGARKNLEAEVPHWDFDLVVRETQESWRKELARIRIDSKRPEVLTNFYTAMYHACLSPTVYQDADGKYRGLDQNNHTAKGFTNHTTFSLWDTYRALHPLFNIIQRERSSDLINSMLAHYDQSAHRMLPIWSHHANENWCMIGYHACLLYTSPSPRDRTRSRMPSSA